MKTSLLSALALTLVLASTRPAVAATPMEAASAPSADPAAGGFIGIDTGPFWLESVSAGSPLNVDFKFKTGWGLTVPFGYDFGNGFSLGLSAGYYDAGFSGVVGNYNGRSQTAEVNGGVSFVPILANAAFHVNLTGKLNWYFGAGAGVVRVDDSFSAFDDPANKSISYGQLGQTANFGGLGSTDWSFGFQAFTGLSYEIAPGVSANLGYRFLHVNDNISVNGSSSGDFNSNSVEIGLMWKP